VHVYVHVYVYLYVYVYVYVYVYLNVFDACLYIIGTNAYIHRHTYSYVGGPKVDVS